MITPKQYVLILVSEYPTLYADSSYEKSAFRVFDQLFNVIGNGIRDHSELIQELDVVPVEEPTVVKYFTGEPLYWGYEKTRDLGHGVIIPDTSQNENIVALESERHLYPNVKLWVQSNGELSDEHPSFKVPYPNFDEAYSTVYRTNFHELGEEWIDAAIWFYEQCNSFFDEKPEYYHYAYPSHNKNIDERLVRDLSERFKSYSSHEEISKAYGVEFHGDIDDFARRRWQSELKDIREFINKTLNMLNAWKVGMKVQKKLVDNRVEVL